MKGQDIGLLLKLICLHKQEKQVLSCFGADIRDWDEQNSFKEGELSPQLFDKQANQYSVRALAESTGISKSQVNLALQRCFEVGLAKQGRHAGPARVNVNELRNLIVYGVRYMFPIKLGSMTRGIRTTLAAPVFKGALMSAGDLAPVWPDPEGKIKGLSVEPLFKSVPYAIKKERDDDFYGLLALIDSIRLGQARERNLAIKMLDKWLEDSGK